MHPLLAALSLAVACTTAASPRPVTADPALAQGTLGAARPLPAGPAVVFALGCDANFFVGPFNFQRSGDAVRLATTVRSADGSQVCAPTAHWVDGSGAPVAVAGVGCAEGAAPVSSEITQDYSPDNGGSSANPVYLHVERHDPAGCVAVELTLARR
ncbi:MAG: hypothetical protein HY909_03950 [Deltaproteobacteria bacterium]|nr:hypothetical protein [Deltaproteobacteria bacterium]